MQTNILGSYKSSKVRQIHIITWYYLLLTSVRVKMREHLELERQEVRSRKHILVTKTHTTWKKSRKRLLAHRSIHFIRLFYDVVIHIRPCNHDEHHDKRTNNNVIYSRTRTNVTRNKCSKQYKAFIWGLLPILRSLPGSPHSWGQGSCL